MATMSHTPAQRKDWHKGKARAESFLGDAENTSDAFIRSINGGNKRGAATPPWAKRGIVYQKPKK